MESGCIAFARQTKLPKTFQDIIKVSLSPDDDELLAMCSREMIYVGSLPRLLDSVPNSSLAEIAWLRAMLPLSAVHSAWDEHSDLRMVPPRATRKSFRRSASRLVCDPLCRKMTTPREYMKLDTSNSSLPRRRGQEPDPVKRSPPPKRRRLGTAYEPIVDLQDWQTLDDEGLRKTEDDTAGDLDNGLTRDQGHAAEVSVFADLLSPFGWLSAPQKSRCTRSLSGYLWRSALRDLIAHSSQKFFVDFHIGPSLPSEERICSFVTGDGDVGICKLSSPSSNQGLIPVRLHVSHLLSAKLLERKRNGEFDTIPFHNYRDDNDLISVFREESTLITPIVAMSSTLHEDKTILVLCYLDLAFYWSVGPATCDLLAASLLPLNLDKAASWLHAVSSARVSVTSVSLDVTFGTSRGLLFSQRFRDFEWDAKPELNPLISECAGSHAYSISSGLIHPSKHMIQVDLVKWESIEIPTVQVQVNPDARYIACLRGSEACVIRLDLRTGASTLMLKAKPASALVPSFVGLGWRLDQNARFCLLGATHTGDIYSCTVGDAPVWTHVPGSSTVAQGQPLVPWSDHTDGHKSEILVPDVADCAQIMPRSQSSGGLQMLCAFCPSNGLMMSAVHCFGIFNDVAVAPNPISPIWVLLGLISSGTTIRHGLCLRLACRGRRHTPSQLPDVLARPPESLRLDNDGSTHVRQPRNQKLRDLERLFGGANANLSCPDAELVQIWIESVALTLGHDPEPVCGWSKRSLDKMGLAICYGIIRLRGDTAKLRTDWELVKEGSRAAFTDLLSDLRKAYRSLTERTSSEKGKAIVHGLFRAPKLACLLRALLPLQRQADTRQMIGVRVGSSPANENTGELRDRPSRALLDRIETAV